MSKYSDGRKGKWNDIPEGIRASATYAGPTDAHVLHRRRLFFARDGFIDLELVKKALGNQRIGMSPSHRKEVGGHSKAQSDRKQREELEPTGGEKSKGMRLPRIDGRTVCRRLKRLVGTGPLE